MKRTVKKGQPPHRSIKPETFDIKVTDPKRLELEALIKKRKRITRKIRRLPDLQQRLAIEKPALSLEQLLDRLKRKKSAADKAIAKHDSFSKRRNETRQFPGGRGATVVMERTQMSELGRQ